MLHCSANPLTNPHLLPLAKFMPSRPTPHSPELLSIQSPSEESSLPKRHKQQQPFVPTQDLYPSPHPSSPRSATKLPVPRVITTSPPTLRSTTTEAPPRSPPPVVVVLVVVGAAAGPTIARTAAAGDAAAAATRRYGWCCITSCALRGGFQTCGSGTSLKKGW
jgi:hypothetical protein